MNRIKRYTMKKIFRKKFIFAILIGVLATVLGSCHFLSVFAKDSAYSEISYSLNYACNKIADNKNISERLAIDMQSRMVENAYALQKLIIADPDIVNDYDMLEEFCEEQGLAELYISDADGVIIASVPKAYIGNDYHDYPGLEKYVDILDNPSLVIIEDLRENIGNPDNTEKMQYAGITRLDEKGIIEVARKNTEYEKYMETTAVNNIGLNYRIGTGGFLVICQNGDVISASAPDMIGLTEEELSCLNCTVSEYTTEYQGIAYLAVKKSYGDIDLYGFLPAREAYSNVFLVLVCLLICDSLIFVLVYGSIMQVINKNVISGIHLINHSLQKITAGDLECEVAVENNEELHILSSGINQMVMTLRTALKVRESKINLVTKERNEIQEKSERDVLTGLYNREKASDLTDRFMASDYYDEKKTAAFVMIDHDNFKGVNDTFGHSCGDFVLGRTAKMLMDHFGKDSYCARLGGDEFCVFVLNEEPGKRFENRIKRFQDDFEQPFYYENKKMAVTCSVGISYYPMHGKERAALYKKADVALYSAKESGRNCYCIYSD